LADEYAPRSVSDDDQVSASLTRLSKNKGVLSAFDSKGEMRSRLQEISLLCATLGQNSILTWSRLMTKTPIAIAATAAAGRSFAQPALGQSNWSPTSIRYNG
jgi:hypothetical protein